MAIIGYARVSTLDQNPQLQLDALQEAGAVRVFTDYGVSGPKTTRPQLDAALDDLREGDVLAVWKLDQAARSTRHVLNLIDILRIPADRFVYSGVRWSLGHILSARWLRGDPTPPRLRSRRYGNRPADGSPGRPPVAVIGRQHDGRAR